MKQRFRSDPFDSREELSWESGFTLIELMVVVTIIAILAAIGLPELSKFVKKAETSDAITVLGALDAGIKAYRSVKGVDAADDILTTSLVSATGSTGVGTLDAALAGYWSRPLDTQFQYGINAISSLSYCLSASPFRSGSTAYVIYWSSSDMSTNASWDGKANITNYVNQTTTVTGCVSS